MIGWIRPLRREFWRLVPWWYRVHHLMSAQAVSFGAIVVSALIYLEMDSLVLPAVWLTALGAIYGNVVQQPEVRNDTSKS